MSTRSTRYYVYSLYNSVPAQDSDNAQEWLSSTFSLRIYIRQDPVGPRVCRQKAMKLSRPALDDTHIR